MHILRQLNSVSVNMCFFIQKHQQIKGITKIYFSRSKIFFLLKRTVFTVSSFRFNIFYRKNGFVFFFLINILLANHVTQLHYVKHSRINHLVKLIQMNKLLTYQFNTCKSIASISYL